jgi:hypothetical protein
VLEFAVPEMKKAAEKLPQSEKIHTFTQKVEYQMKYSESSSFCAVGYFPIPTIISCVTIPLPRRIKIHSDGASRVIKTMRLT